MKTKLERTEEALAVAQAFICIMRKSGLLTPGRREELALEYGGRIDAILNPPPEMETVEIVRWVFLTAGNQVQCGYGTEEDARMWANGCVDRDRLLANLVKLTGTIQRPKPQPVEKVWTLENASFVEDQEGACRWVRVAPFVDGIPTGKTGELVYTYHK